jgi:hypothetical protein
MPMRIEAFFGGALALFVLVVAVLAILSNGRRDRGPEDYGREPVIGQPAQSGRDDMICACFNDGFALAGQNVGVMSSQYRTGFEYCRAQLGEDGGCAWTAGWNAQLSSRPFDASCRTFLRRPTCS